MNNRGQVVVEYVLLLVIAVSISVVLLSALVKRDPDNPGILVAKWHQILSVVGDDLPDKR